MIDELFEGKVGFDINCYFYQKNNIHSSGIFEWMNHPNYSVLFYYNTFLFIYYIKFWFTLPPLSI